MFVFFIQKNITERQNYKRKLFYQKKDKKLIKSNFTLAII